MNEEDNDERWDKNKNITTTTETGWIGCKCWALGPDECDKPLENTYKWDPKFLWLGRRRNTRTVCINRCVLFCFGCSGPVSLHVKWADGASEPLRAPCPLPSGGLPFHSGAWNTEHREGQKDTASKLLKDGVEQLKEDCSFKHEDSGRNREISFILWFVTLSSENWVNISVQELDLQHK